MTIKQEFKVKAFNIALAFGCLTISLVTGCGKAESNTVSASIIPGPGGYTCFGISDGEKIVGGNCIAN